MLAMHLSRVSIFEQNCEGCDLLLVLSVGASGDQGRMHSPTEAGGCKVTILNIHTIYIDKVYNIHRPVAVSSLLVTGNNGLGVRIRKRRQHTQNI